MKQAFVLKGCANNPADLAFVAKRGEREMRENEEKGVKEKEGRTEANTKTRMAQAKG